MQHLALAAVLVVLAGCTTAPPKPAPSPAAPPAAAPGTPSSKYYADDGPPLAVPVDLDAIPDAVPRAEPLHRFANRPYTVMGREYVPATALRPYRERGTASWYGRKFHGQKTSTGEVYDMFAMTAAHPTLPIPSYVRVTQVDSGRSVVLRVNDRGPFHADRLIDLSYAAAYRLGLLPRGQGLVRVESLLPPFDTKPVAAATDSMRTQDGAPAAVTGGSAADASRGAYLQLGAFSQRENAQAFLARIGAELEWLAPRTSLRSDGALFRVQAGPFDDDQQASEAAARVKAVMDFQPMIVR